MFKSAIPSQAVIPARALEYSISPEQSVSRFDRDAPRG